MSPEAGIALSGSIVVLGLFILVSVLADAWLVATGIQLLRRSRYARRSAITFACLMAPLGAIDLRIASHSGESQWILLSLVALLPVYALAQVVAFFALPSWRAITTGSEARSTH